MWEYIILTIVCLTLVIIGGYLTSKVMQRSLENNADPDCTLCDGKGWHTLYRMDNEDVNRECDCVSDFKN